MDIVLTIEIYRKSLISYKIYTWHYRQIDTSCKTNDYPSSCCPASILMLALKAARARILIIHAMKIGLAFAVEGQFSGHATLEGLLPNDSHTMTPSFHD